MSWVNINGKDYYICECDDCGRTEAIENDDPYLAHMADCPDGCTRVCIEHIDEDYKCSVCGMKFLEYETSGGGLDTNE